MKLIAVFLMTGVSRAFCDQTDFYFNFDSGAVFQQPTTILSHPIPFSGTFRDHVTFNPGFRSDVRIGYHLDQSWSAELATGFIWNSVNRIDGIPVDAVGNSIDIYQVPIMANIVYRVPLDEDWTFRVESGIGGDFSVYDYTLFGGGGPSTHASGQANAFSLAYGAGIGLEYALSEQISAGIDYKFLSIVDQSWNLNINGAGYHAAHEGVYMHAVVASFIWRF
ncbi:MAG TPA: outer membrane beta-barrel protein [Pyrinomonadaceae bacterium]|nr:outer membrane beta-barrel protein [Pyrinomonadaceae bacterium]